MGYPRVGAALCPQCHTAIAIRNPKLPWSHPHAYTFYLPALTAHLCRGDGDKRWRRARSLQFRDDERATARREDCFVLRGCTAGRVLVHNGRRHQRPLNTISGGSMSRSNALAVLRKPRVQSSVLNRSIAMSSITASAAGTPPADQAFKSVRVAA